ncbi:uroporphyrinogen-III C-methyltransferase [Alkalilimnicola ehrlichii MLHE-1]|uniref:Uroporphyrin-3 C-methyltransferase n=1 Tax=Alkalilimnicola ehrlichii (strain ATCC BAA-1101 / DSM 17681 / MLHE-1) TaxID=187272 RepID=Q0A579_ALKEH|nr:uroporphyrinogen-III C-methyltransferase [Alkalilimnicola ehrlichii]ABI58008.1 protein of unknown function DUF513, hemX [Alkalilimnicola ehrlichii MLHE-1]
MQENKPEREEEKPRSEKTGGEDPQGQELTASAAAPEPGKGGGGTPPAGGDGDGTDKDRQGGPWKQVVALLVVVLVLGAAATWWLTGEMRELRAEQARMVSADRLDERSDALERQLARLEDRVTDTGERAASARERADEAGDALGTLREQLDELRARQGGFEEGLERLGARAEANRENWIRSEAAYLATVAVHRMRFHRDPKTALGALQAADKLMADIGASESVPARVALNEAVTQVLEWAPPEVGRLAATLADLEGRVDGLPMPAERATGGIDLPRMAADEGDPVWLARLKDATGRVQAGLGELVVVQREEAAPPLVAPDQRYFLRENLKLRLEAARLAALQGDQDLWEDSLQRAHDWVLAHFDTSDLDVEAVADTLARLRRQDIDPELPDIATTLEPVKPFL